MSKTLNEELRDEINLLARELLAQYPDQLYISGYTKDGGILLGVHHGPADPAGHFEKKETT
jgi:hypothetical protein